VNERADVLLLCGDLTDYGLPQEARVLVKELSVVRVPVLAVLGNHDYESGQSAEVTQILKQRCEISSFGPRTEELLRNALLLLADNSLTLLEVGSLLTKASFRAQCLRRATNQEVRSYFEARFNGVSDAMRATITGPVLNKLTAFTADPHFRHILGQQKSTFSLIDAMDHSRWVILNLDKAAHL